MKIAGLKLTHDGAFAVAEDNKLLFSIELEKLENNKRHAAFYDLSVIDRILSFYGMTRKDIDKWIIDGWEHDPEQLCQSDVITLKEENLKVNGYHNYGEGRTESQSIVFQSREIGEYTSYTHIFAHLCASYCTSPFSCNNEDSYVLCFDGGVKPVLYYYDSSSHDFVFLKELLKFGGDIYTGVASHTETFAFSRRVINGYPSFTQKYAGRIMAYIALGGVRPEILKSCEKIYEELSLDNSIQNQWKENRKFERCLFESLENRFLDCDILASFHAFLQEKLISGLREAVGSFPCSAKNLCLAGGSFLNIKWNSAIRSSGLFANVYAPPFTNDSGNAIGAVCAYNLINGGCPHLEWNTYGGPPLIEEKKMEGWDEMPCSLEELAGILAQGNLVVFLNGRSELGPRALGARSILADPRGIAMKTRLNTIKGREAYRPVAPVCLLEDAPLYFKPGTEDRFMLFEHMATDLCKEKAPAVVHIDGTARLQSVSKRDNHVLYKLLQEFKRLTEVPILCNTSANDLGKGFFPSVKAAQSWGKIDYIWSDGIIYKKQKYFDEQTERLK